MAKAVDYTKWPKPLISGEIIFGLAFERPGQLADYCEPTPDECQQKACEVCGACSKCKAFHYYTGNGCTENTCPLMQMDAPLR